MHALARTVQSDRPEVRIARIPVPSVKTLTTTVESPYTHTSSLSIFVTLAVRAFYLNPYTKFLQSAFG